MNSGIAARGEGRRGPVDFLGLERDVLFDAGGPSSGDRAGWSTRRLDQAARQRAVGGERAVAGMGSFISIWTLGP